jgi:hypothetical protein
MKNTILYRLIIISLLVISCQDSTLETDVVHFNQSQYNRLKDYPANSLNPHDTLGLAFYRLYDAYYSSLHEPVSIEAVVDTLYTLALQDSVFMQIAEPNYVYDAITETSTLFNCTSICLDSYISNHFSSSTTQEELSDFIFDYMLLCQSMYDYEDVHDYITTYEDSIFQDSLLLSIEKRKLLVLTSIARYAAYAKKKKPKKNTDPEWTLLVLSLFGTLDGMERSDADAVFESLVLGIMDNK